VKEWKKVFKAALLSMAVLITAATTLWAGEWMEKDLGHHWLLSIKPTDAKFVTVNVTKDKRERFLCLTYKLENKSPKLIPGARSTIKTDKGKTIKFIARPAVVLKTDTGKTFYSADMPKVKKRLEYIEQKKFLSDKGAAGAFERGKPKEIVSIFPMSDLRAKNFTFQVRGLTNNYKAEEKDGKTRVIKRVYEVRYYWPGDTVYVYTRKLYFIDSKWAWKEVKLRKLDPDLVTTTN